MSESAEKPSGASNHDEDVLKASSNTKGTNSLLSGENKLSAAMKAIGGVEIPKAHALRELTETIHGIDIQDKVKSLSGLDALRTSAMDKLLGGTSIHGIDLQDKVKSLSGLDALRTSAMVISVF